jgi:predicted nucleic acid-binding protein
VEILLDSSVLVDTLRRRRGRPEWLRQMVSSGARLSTTPVNVAEIYAGMRPHEQVRTDGLMSGLYCYEITAVTGRIAGDLKRMLDGGRTVSLPDILVAAVAIENGLPVATDNLRDFVHPGLQIFPLPD